MDLVEVTDHRWARTRADLRLAPGERLLGGGTWLFSEPQPGTTGLVDLTTMEWPAWEALPGGGLRIAATCTIEELQAVPGAVLGGAARVVHACADALLMSFKVAAWATVGGNLCLALPAAAMVSLTAGLGGEVVVWTPDGGERREPVASFVTGPGSTTLAPGEVLRAVDLPAAALAARTAFRRTSLARLGRSAAVVVGRANAAGTTLTLTAATPRPVVLAFPGTPPWVEVDEAVRAITDWYADPHGAPDWRRAMTRRLAAEVLAELGDVTPPWTGGTA
ncbi:FAD binding domain-containing protein [Nocardioides ferulae]|uniref:FAD binding domain-containing protein n=1 Tax=Nocardioides ferulae TaxID=2340821 RepID=UPI000EB191F5|nr:FAD binding domain-containing protein [Nocardioides ferulae]